MGKNQQSVCEEQNSYDNLKYPQSHEAPAGGQKRGHRVIHKIENRIITGDFQATEPDKNNADGKP